MGVQLSTTVPTPQADGVYPYAIPTQPGLPPAQQTNLIGLVGYANWGPVDQPVQLNTLGQAIYVFGANGNLPVAAGDATNGGNNASIVGAIQSASPEGSNFSCVRVGYSSQYTLLAATLALLDGSAGTVANLAAAYEGSDGNTITLQINLLNGSTYASGAVTVQAVVKIIFRMKETDDEKQQRDAQYDEHEIASLAVLHAIILPQI